MTVLSRDGQSGESGTSDLEQSIRAVGYRTTIRLTTDTQLAATNCPSADLLDRVRAGGDLLFLSVAAL